MKNFHFDANGHHFQFVCTDRNTRNGFAHDCSVFIDGNEYETAAATCHYLNRTWEMYAYQSVMQRLAGDRIALHMERERDAFMRARGYQKMTAKRKAEFIEYLDHECDNKSLQTWVKVYELITNHGIMEPPYPEWYGHRPRTFAPSNFAR